MNRFVTTMGRVILITMACVAMLTLASCGKPSATQVAEGMVDSMAKGDFASATRDFDATMAAAMSSEKLGQTWAQLTAQAGAFKSRTGSREAQEASFQMVYVTCQFEKTSLDIRVVIGASGQVGGLWFVPTQPAK